MRRFDAVVEARDQRDSHAALAGIAAVDRAGEITAAQHGDVLLRVQTACVGFVIADAGPQVEGARRGRDIERVRQDRDDRGELADLRPM